MSNPTQHDVLDRMIARLEEANAKSYSSQPRVDEAPLESDDDDRNRLSSQPAAPKRPSRGGRQWLVVVVLMIIAAAYFTIFGSASSDVDRVKLTIARWVDRNASQTLPLGGAVLAPQIPREIESRLQKMAGESAELQQQIEQLKASQDLASRSGAETAAQFKIDREQMMRDNASLADQLRVTQEQLKATQAQLTDLVSVEAANSGRRRRRVSALSQRARARSSVR